MKRHLLFVDDDANAVEYLSHAFCDQRNEWDFHFASSGCEALMIMEKQPIKIIITDISMPIMSGIELLENAAHFYPGTIRMALSACSECDLVMKSVKVTHQYLSKPCAPETLKAVISQLDGSGTLLQNENLIHLVSRLGKLPDPPSAHYEILREMQSQKVDIEKIGEIISRDPNAEAKVMQFANSVFFGCRQRLSNITDAVSFLGVAKIIQLLLAISAFSEFRPAGNGTLVIEDLWTHSTSTAIEATKIAQDQQAPYGVFEDSFIAGLLHDIGKLILANRLPEEYERTVLEATRSQIPLWIAENESFSVTHAEVGAYLLAIWDLPNSIVDAVAFHHNPSASEIRHFSALNAVHAANTFVHFAENEPLSV
jgi:putative nucleotidyltransferase with HDIG domain